MNKYSIEVTNKRTNITMVIPFDSYENMNTQYKAYLNNPDFIFVSGRVGY